ncbi:hypothetical protein BJV82DRAFT_627629 [Fennellomyces sp. T-0311]|nr:hypothetical protein BJV82DRAFT_627629 [Fennellomyces sp. T-0311]
MQDYYLRHGTFANVDNAALQLTLVGTVFQAVALSFVFLVNIVYPLFPLWLYLLSGITLQVVGLLCCAQATAVCLKRS